MDTYGDLITLLLCFFVLLYSMSTMDEAKWQYIAQAFSGGKGEVRNVVVDKEPNPDNDPNAIYVDQSADKDSEEIDFEDFYLYLETAIASANLEESVSVEMASTGVYMKFRDNVFFKGDSYELLDEGKYILEVICDGVRAVDKSVLAVKVNGHTAQSAGSKANEWELSSGRSNAVINFMLSLDCCEPSKFSAAGYGGYRPVSDNDTEEGKRQNRRVEIVFIRNDLDMQDPQVMMDLLKEEFGPSFAAYSNADGDEAVSAEGEPEKEVSENSGNFVSKSDYIRNEHHSDTAGES